MNVLTEQIKVLKESIEHWKRLLCDMAGIEETTGSDDCACCKRYMARTYSHVSCRSCPIAQDSGDYLCRNTPYDTEDISDLIDEDGGKTTSIVFKQAAAKELHYLYQILTKLEKRL